MDRYVPKRGDRVRVTVEGVIGFVSNPNDDVRIGEFAVGHPDGANVFPLNWPARNVVNVEKLPDPLPTTPGSVVMSDGLLLLRASRGHWVSESGITYTDEDVAKGHAVSVQHDAGADR